MGGPDLAITVVNKAEGRSTLELFLKYFKLKGPEIKASVIIGDNQQGVKTVAGNPGAIGYVSIGAAEVAQEQGESIKLLPIKGIKPSLANVKNGSFPISRPLNLVLKNEPVGLTKTFIDFAQSKNVNTIIKDLYFVPVAD